VQRRGTAAVMRHGPSFVHDGDEAVVQSHYDDTM
jgi:hypothetical protein